MLATPSHLLRTLISLLPFLTPIAALPPSPNFEDSLIILDIITPTNVKSCGTLNVTWTITNTGVDDDADTVLYTDSCYVGITITNIVTDNLPEVTQNITTTDYPLRANGTGSTNFVWTPATLPPNVFYVIEMFSLPNHYNSLTTSARSAPFQVTLGTTDCLAGVEASLAYASSTKAAMTAVGLATLTAGTATGGGAHNPNPTASVKSDSQTEALVNWIAVLFSGLILSTFL